MKIKLKKATKHERKYLLKKADSEGAFYENTIVVDATRNRISVLLAIIHELCHVLGMDEEEASVFTNKAVAIISKNEN